MAYVNLIGSDGVVASVSLEQSFRGARYQFECAYFQYHLHRGRRARALVAGVDVSHFYRRCRDLGIRVA